MAFWDIVQYTYGVYLQTSLCIFCLEILLLELFQFFAVLLSTRKSLFFCYFATDFEQRSDSLVILLVSSCRASQNIGALDDTLKMRIYLNTGSLDW